MFFEKNIITKVLILQPDLNFAAVLVVLRQLFFNLWQNNLTFAT